MRTYFTQGGRYPVEKVGGVDAIRARKGAQEGNLFIILGSYNPEEHKVIAQGGLLLYDEKSYSIDDFVSICRVLEPVKRGNRLITKLCDKDGKFFPVGEQKDDVMVTSKVVDIED